MTSSVDCVCDSTAPYCAPCLVHTAYVLTVGRDKDLTVTSLKRVIPKLTGREASILVEATKRIRI